MFINNKYTKWYNNIISNAVSRQRLDEYTEKHHIIPKSLGGIDSNDNIVSLTAREHFICHFLLTKMTAGNEKKKMLHAAWAFTRSSRNQQRDKINSKTYEIIRSELAKTLSEDRKGTFNVGKKRTPEQIANLVKKLTGQKRTEETKLKMKESWKTRAPRSQQHKDALSLANLGRKHPIETRAKMSASKKGIVPKASYIPFKCEHCGKEGKGATNYKRWHGNNCKALKNG
jgi:hypothetical protein